MSGNPADDGECDMLTKTLSSLQGVVLTDQNLTDWVAALRSGNYAQGKGMLVSNINAAYPEYCCLGVLGRVVGLDDDTMKCSGYLSVRDAAGDNAMKEAVLLSYNTQCTLGAMNDNRALTFAEIAHHIDTHREKLLKDSLDWALAHPAPTVEPTEPAQA